MKHSDKELLYKGFTYIVRGILLIMQQTNRPAVRTWGNETLELLEGELSVWLDRKR